MQGHDKLASASSHPLIVQPLLLLNKAQHVAVSPYILRCIAHLTHLTLKQHLNQFSNKLHVNEKPTLLSGQRYEVQMACHRPLAQPDFPLTAEAHLCRKHPECSLIADAHRCRNRPECSLTEEARLCLNQPEHPLTTEAQPCRQQLYTPSWSTRHAIDSVPEQSSVASVPAGHPMADALNLRRHEYIISTGKHKHE